MQNTISYHFGAHESEQNTFSVRFDSIGELGNQIFGTERKENGKMCVDEATGNRAAYLLNAAVPDIYMAQMQRTLSEHRASGGTADLTQPGRNVLFHVTAPSEIPAGTPVPYGSFCINLENALRSDDATFEQTLSVIQTHRDCLPVRIAGSRPAAPQGASTSVLEQLAWSVVNTRPDGGSWGSSAYVPASGASKRFVQAALDLLANSCATAASNSESDIALKAKVMQQAQILWDLEDPQVSAYSSDRSELMTDSE